MPGVRRVGGSTRKVGVIGWPVSESLSPVIHNAAFEALGLDWIYLPLPVPPGELPRAIAGLPALGFAGANVTMPHKTEAAALVDALSEDAARTRAVNTIVVPGVGAERIPRAATQPAGAEPPPHRLEGHNTDVAGFDRFLRRDAGFDPAGRSALVYGAGGAARACALALARGGLARLTVAARSPERASGMRETVDGLGTEVRIVPFDGAAGLTVDLVVNATPSGLVGSVVPLPGLGPTVLAVDLVYRSGGTAFLALARAGGAVTFGGLGMLIHQAALSFELWTGQAAPLSVMSAAATAELAEPAR